MERSDDSGDLDRIAVHPVDPAADGIGEDCRRDRSAAASVTASGSYSTTTAPVARCRRSPQQHGAVAGRAAADVVAEVDQHDRLSRRLHGLADRFRGRGQRTSSWSRTSHIRSASSSATRCASARSPSATAITPGPIAGTSA